MAEDIDDKNKEESNKAFGPSKASLKAQQEYFDRAVDLNDQLRFQVSNLNEKTAIDREQVKISNQLVQSVKKLKGEYLDQKDLSKEIGKIEASKTAQQKIQNNLSQQFTSQDKKRMQLALNREKGIQNQKKELAQIIAQDAKGLAIDEERKAELEARISSQQKGLATMMKNLSAEEKQFMVGKKNLKLTEEILEALEEEEASLERINNAMGISGGALKSINKLFGGALGDTDKILANTTKRLKALDEEGKLTGENGDKLKGFEIISEEVGKAIYKNMLDPLILIGQALNYSKQMTDFRKELGLSYLEAASFRAEMTQIASSSFDINSLTSDLAVNSRRVTETMAALNKEFGTGGTSIAEKFPDVVHEATKLQHLMGLSAKATADFAGEAIRTGKPLKDIKEDAIGAVVAAEAETGARLNIREVLEATSQVSGQVRAQLEGNPVAIAKAVATAKQFGMELKDVEQTAKSLLNFEQSIEAELEAELLTGKQLNLERARLAALTGDYEALSREINEQVGTFADFSKMNVLQQNALAKSFGMTSNELSDQLLKKADLAKLAQEARDAGDEELALNLESRNTSEKFLDIVEKIKTIFVDLIAGPLTLFLDTLGNILSIFTPILNAVGYIAAQAAKFASLDFENMSTLQIIVGGIAASFITIKGVMLAMNSYAMIQKGIQKATLALGIQRGITENVINTGQKKGNALGLIGMARAAGKFILKMFTAGTTAAGPGPQSIILPFIMGALAGGIASSIIGQYSKGDDVISPGYGKRVLSSPEGSIALNNKDTVIAGTDLFKGDDIISTPPGTNTLTDPIDYNKMAMAMSSVQVQSQMSYDPFAARNSQGSVFYGNQAKQNKML